MDVRIVDTSFDDETFDAVKNKLLPYTVSLRDAYKKKTYSFPEASIVLPSDEEVVGQVENIVRVLGPVKHVVLIGIGGSSVGTEAVYGALGIPGVVHLHVFDLLDAERLLRAMPTLLSVPLSDIAILVISKSGKTTETLANAGVIIDMLYAQYGDRVYSRVVAIGDPDTPLADLAKARGAHVLAMPPIVGGRFSVLSAVGLLPLALLGIDIRSLSKGADERVRAILSDSESSAHRTAALLAHRIEHNTHTYVLFAECERLSPVMRWYQQLIAESLGKVRDDGVVTGIVPVLMTPRELHSTAQLFLSGFPGVLTGFFFATHVDAPYALGVKDVGGMVAMRGDRSYTRIVNAIRNGVRAAYTHEDLPHTTTDIGRLTEETLGAFLAEKMLEIMFTAHLLGIDAFDQPHVEVYKRETRKLLE